MTNSFEKFDLSLKQCNQRLKAANVRVRIERKGHSLYARATLPPKPDSIQIKPHQQHVPLNVKATSAGLKRAEIEAKKIAVDLDLKKFTWENYSLRAQKAEHRTVADWIAAYEGAYFECRGRTPTTETSFKNHLHSYLKRLPQNESLTAIVLERAIKRTEPNTCSRALMCRACKKFGQFAEINVSFITKELRGTYSSRKPAPRDLPDDVEIEEGFYSIPNKGWQWVYGIIATFGLRPHEIFHLDTQNLEEGGCVLMVLDQTKTGYREVHSFHPEWIDMFGLRQKQLPNIKVEARSNQALGGRISAGFRMYEIPFPPYHLRHCYAVRCVRYKIQVSLAARWMGHSVAIHTNTYQAWISKSVEQEAFKQAIQAPDRPLPPGAIQLDKTRNLGQLLHR